MLISTFQSPKNPSKNYGEIFEVRFTFSSSYILLSVISSLSLFEGIISQSMWFGSNHIQCSCVELGCANELFERDGATHPGRLFHRTNYARHQAQRKKAIPPEVEPQPALNSENTSMAASLPSNAKETLGSSSQNPTDHLTVSDTHRTSQKRGRDSFASDLDLTHN